MNTKTKKIIPLIIFIAVFIIAQQEWRTGLDPNTINVESINQGDIVMYSTNWCPYCRKARLFFRQANIPYTEYDIEKSANANKEYLRISGRGVPVFVIGEQIIQGFDKTAIREALAELTKHQNTDA